MSDRFLFCSKNMIIPVNSDTSETGLDLTIGGGHCFHTERVKPRFPRWGTHHETTISLLIDSRLCHRSLGLLQCACTGFKYCFNQ